MPPLFLSMDLPGISVSIPLHISDFATIDGRCRAPGVFSRMLPFAGDNIRIILVNRRDYPGSIPLGDTERTILESANSSHPTAPDAINSYMKDRAQEFRDFLELLVIEENIPIGSMVVAGWSFGSTFILALLAYAASLSTTRPSLDLTKYIKRMVIYGT